MQNVEFETIAMGFARPVVIEPLESFHCKHLFSGVRNLPFSIDNSRALASRGMPIVFSDHNIARSAGTALALNVECFLQTLLGASWYV